MQLLMELIHRPIL